MGSAIQEHVIRTSVLEACTRQGVPQDSTLRHQLENEAELADGSSYVRASNGATLDARIEELKRVPKFAQSLPSAKPTVPSTDMTALSQNLEKIARGEITVK